MSIRNLLSSLFAMPALIVVPLTASSAPSIVGFSWHIPNEYENGSALSVEEIEGYNIYEDGNLIIKVEGGSVDSASYKPETYGEKCWTITTVDIYGMESYPSEALCDIVKKPRPNAPTGLNVSFGI